MAQTHRVTVRIAEAAILRLEEILTRQDRPLNPKSRAAMVEQVLTLAGRIFDVDDGLLLTTREDLSRWVDESVEIADRLIVQSVKAAVADLYGEDIEAERSIDGRYFTLRRADDTRTARLPNSRAELSVPNLEHVR